MHDHTGQPLIAFDYSPRGGRGVFAAQTLLQETIVEVCPYIVVPTDNLNGKVIDYVFHGDDDANYLMLLGFGMLYNHSSNPNLTYCLGEEESVIFQTTRAIAQGEELTISYSDEWWTSRDQVPRES